eukprot:scaffold43291_cov25-Prasinocladus_malaysianus.AAC.1
MANPTKPALPYSSVNYNGKDHFFPRTASTVAQYRCPRAAGANSLYISSTTKMLQPGQRVPCFDLRGVTQL